MMEQGEEMKVKTLRQRFMNDESSKIRMKPALPDKPKTIPPISPTTKIGNPLIASINSAMENRLAPRVVFKDAKKPHPLSQPETSMIKAKPYLPDKKQKKEADLIKQALKDKKILPMSPVTPLLEQKPKSESIQNSPGLETRVKIPTPLKTAIWNNTSKDERDEPCLSEWDVPASSVLDYSDFSSFTHAKAEDTFNKPVVPKALVPPVRTNPSIHAQIISSPAVSPSKPPARKVLESVSPNCLQKENLRPEIPLTINSNIFSYGLSGDAESPDHFDLDIPPPIIPEDFSDHGTSSVLDTSPNMSSFPWASLSVTPIPRNPALTRTASPIQAIETTDSNSVFTFSPPPARLSPLLNVESMGENVLTKSHKEIRHMEKPLEVPLPSSPATASVASALARAEEMAPVKPNACDQRLFKLLEKAKQKSTIGTRPSTPDILPVVETDLLRNYPLESPPPETAFAEPVSHVDAPNSPETLWNLSDIPYFNYEGIEDKTATTEYNTLPHETASDNQAPRQSSPASKMVVLQRPLVPPPPPPRKPQSTVANGGITPEELPHTPSEDKKPTILPSLPLENNEPIFEDPADFASEEDNTFDDPSERVGSQKEPADLKNPGPSVHEKSFFDHLEHQTPNKDNTDIGFPRTVTTEYIDSAPNFGLVSSNSTLPSPTGKQINYSSSQLEDVASNKKAKTQKRSGKGSPMNPYADASFVKDERPRKTLFNKNNSESDDKELKLKEKQKDKEKEKDKKDKKKEQKEKEREKKEQKEKEKKENEMKKKFRITGEEAALYQAKVTETTKGRKDDLAIKAGEIVSIIRTTDCPKGKWLARDNTNKYGYIPVESVEMNIQEIMELGTKAKANNTPRINGMMTPSTDSISTHNYNLNPESFEDDSEEWGDDDDAVFPIVHTTDIVRNQRLPSSDTGSKTAPGLPAHTDHSGDVHEGREALHKLTTFFAQPTVPLVQNNTSIKEPAPLAVIEQEPVNSLKQEVDLQILPPPDLYADIVVG